MNKIVVITGANSGIGKAAAIKFAAQGYRIVMACRDIKASKPVCREIILGENYDSYKLYGDSKIGLFMATQKMA